MTRKQALIAGAVVVVAAGGWTATHRGPKPHEVQIHKVGREDLQAKVTSNGKVQAQRKVDISATIAGQVTHLAVKEGDPVKKGQFLLQIDPANPRAAARSSEASLQALQREVESARANLAQARADFERAERNHQALIIPLADLDRARTALATNEAALQAAERRVEQARATLDGAQDQLSKTTVRSPMDGIVTAKRVEEGEVAVVGVLNQPGTVLLQISDMSIVETEMEVDETSVPSVKLGQEALVRVDAYPNRTFHGAVTEVGSSPIVKQNAQPNEAIKFKVKIQIKDPPEGIKPGLSVQADILTGFAGQAVVVPIQALVVRDIERKPGEQPKPGEARDEEGVFLMEGNKARFQRIKTGLLGELNLQVVEGLQGGETVISGPFRALREMKPGDPVKLEKPKKDASPSPH
ncbi:MAG TPA: efflux RND transporter periplasmic adaptor subunit [Vicinamibacteria bacterium]|nr:efflux RND transporter periplasmic adaptor subunit [Vicinamibacteria bacterium]